MRAPRVSIIMGVFNEKKEYLERAVKSIITQTFQDWEFIICDDGSTNQTYEWLLDLKSQDDRIILLKNEKNIGLAPTLNKCLEKSAGEYIARMDSDDISLPNRLEKQIKQLDLYEIDFVGSWAELIDGNGVWATRKTKKYPKKNDFLLGTQFIHPSVIMKKHALVRINSYRIAPETIRTEDYDLFMRMYSQGLRGMNIQEPLLRYTESRDSYAKRKFKYRYNELIVRFKGFRQLGLMPIGLLFMFKPILIGLIPGSFLRFIKRKIK